MTEYSHHEKLTALQYELRRRRRVFTALVEEGRMRQDKADREIEIFEEIVEDYEASRRLGPVGSGT